MLIRELRDDELYKSAKLSALAFSYAVNIEEKKKETLKEHTFGAFLDDNETLIAQVVAIDYVSFHNGTPGRRGRHRRRRVLARASARRARFAPFSTTCFPSPASRAGS